MKTILLDVDDTLYPKGAGPFKEVNSRIDTYVMSVCRVDLDAARRIRKSYISAYGSTLQGLMRHYGIDPGHYLVDVHNVPVEEILKSDARLHDVLGKLSSRLVAFTNGSYEYAYRILRVLGIDDLVGELFSIEYMDFIPKPLPWAYHKAMELYGGTAKDYLVIDDSIANVRTALEVGMAAVLVGAQEHEGFCLNMTDIYEIHSLFEKGLIQ
jgi:putative hydrolase of the HAD superfamily